MRVDADSRRARRRVGHASPTTGTRGRLASPRRRASTGARVESRLLRSVDLRRVVRRGRAEAVAPFSRGRVHVAAGVDDDRPSVEPGLERQAVVVSVAAAAREPDRAAVDDDVRTGASEDVHARRREGARRQVGLRSVRQRRRPLGSEQPGDLGAWAGEERSGLLIAPRCADDARQVAVVARPLPAERKRPGVVVVAEDGRRAVRARDDRGKTRHRRDPLAVPRRHVEPHCLSVERRKQEELGHQPVIRDRRFEVDAVLVDLPRQLVEQDRPALGGPTLRFGSVAEEEAGKYKPSSVGGVVVAVHGRTFDVARDEPPMEVQVTQKRSAKLRVGGGFALPAGPEEPRPREDAKGRLHRDRPVGAERVRVVLDPVPERVSNGRREALLPCQEISLARG